MTSTQMLAVLGAHAVMLLDFPIRFLNVFLIGMRAAAQTQGFVKQRIVGSDQALRSACVRAILSMTMAVLPTVLATSRLQGGLLFASTSQPTGLGVTKTLTVCRVTAMPVNAVAIQILTRAVTVEHVSRSPMIEPRFVFRRAWIASAMKTTTA